MKPKGPFVIRLLEKQEIEQAIALADQVFRNDGRKSMRFSLPQVFSTSLNQGIGCFLGSRLISFAGLVPAIIRLGNVQLTVYSYGAVCTDPEFRGLGIASNVLDVAQKFVTTAKASLLFVSGELPIYLNAGLQYFGQIFMYRLHRDVTRQKSSAAGHYPITYREAERTDWLQLYKLSQQRPIAFEQSIWDIADLTAAASIAAIRNWQQKIFMIIEGKQEVGYIVLAYDADDQSAERKGQVIEWAGNNSQIQLAIAMLMEQYNLTQVEWHSNEQVEMLTLPHIQFDVEKIRNQGTVYICNVQQLFEELQPLFHQLAEEDGWIPQIQTINEHQLHIRIGPYQSEPMDKQQLLQHIFGDAVGTDADTATSDGAGIMESEVGVETIETIDSIDDVETVDYHYQQYATKFFPVPLPYTKGLNFI